MCPACIHGFFQMIPSGVPTKMLREDKGKTLETIHAVVHVFKKYMFYNNLQKNLVGLFHLGR